jgi:tRNA pseudouridine32 synthase/23S rRNA pseudouridine746 synthase
MAHAARNPLIPEREGVSPSCVATPSDPSGQWPLLLDFLAERLPALTREAWAQRMAEGWVWSDAAQPLAPDAPFGPQTRVHYWRHSPHEPALPAAARVLFQDAHLVVADKPHFMPVTPTGPFVQHSLLVQLKRELGLPELSPIHRIDRDTAGLVVLAVQARERAAYQSLFRDRAVHKRYEAIAPAADVSALAAQGAGMGSWTRLDAALCATGDAPIAAAQAAAPPARQTPQDLAGDAAASAGLSRDRLGSYSGLDSDSDPIQPAWCYRSRLEPHAHFFTMHEVAGEANCETHLQCLARDGHWARYALVPHTGRRHQLRAHLSALGLPLRHDPYYPQVSRGAHDADDWQRPLQLLARQLGFTDPVTGEARRFDSQLQLAWPLNGG